MSSRLRRASSVLALALATMTLACDDKPSGNAVITLPTQPTVATAPRRVVGIAEVTFENVTSPKISASLRLATSIADIERARGSATGSGATAIAGLQTDLIATGEFAFTPDTGTGVRYFAATFGLRNIAGAAAVIDSLRQNLSFIPIRTANTIGDSPVRVFTRGDGAAANRALAGLITPSVLSAIDGDGRLVTIAQNNLRTLTSADIAKTALAADATALLPFAFVVQRFLPDPNALSGPSTARFDGVVTMAFRFPDQVRAADNPSTISVLFLIIDDTAAPTP